MRLLITGASGFVGSSTVRAAAAAADVVAVARRHPVPGAAETILISDIADDLDWAPHLADMDAVIHLAARVHVMRDSARSPLAAYRRTNVQGTTRLAEAAVAAGVRRFVFVSTVKVHGEETTNEPFTEDSPFRPTDSYGHSKAEAEEALRAIEAGTGLEVVVVRPPLVYGPGVGANFLRLLEAVNRGIPLPLARVANRRSLLYVENLADLLLRAATSPAASGHAFLAADGEPVSTADLVRALARALGRSPRLIPVPVWILRAAGRALRRGPAIDRLLGSLEVDGSRACATLDWRPPVSFEAGVGATAAWFAESGAT